MAQALITYFSYPDVHLMFFNQSINAELFDENGLCLHIGILQQCEVHGTINQGGIDKDMHRLGLKYLSFFPEPS